MNLAGEEEEAVRMHGENDREKSTNLKDIQIDTISSLSEEKGTGSR